MNNIKRVILCADDYGQKPAVSQAIVQLVQQGRLSAVSCLVTGADWPAHWAALQPFQDKIDVGLHFNLTEGVPLSIALRHQEGFRSVGRLLCKSLARQLDPAVIALELIAQLEQFHATTGRLPDFIDGHQHVQHFRGVREALLTVYAARLRGSGCYIRCIDDPTVWRLPPGPAWFKRFVLQVSGASALRRSLEAARIPHNVSFSGIYPFAKAAHYADFFPRFLDQIGDQGLILCHPGLGEPDAMDPIAAVRPAEHAYLLGDAFTAACEAAGVRLARFREWSSPFKF